MKRLRMTAAAAIIAAASVSSASAQLGTYQLPSNNFIWRWGDENQRHNQRFEDLRASGGEAGFRCDLDAGLSPASHLTSMDVRQMEAQLNASIDFIYKSSNLMNQLHASRDIDWATLTCQRPEATPSSDEEKAEHEQRAKEKMQKEIERRRARQQSSSN